MTTTDITTAARAAIQHLLAGDPVSVRPEDIGGWWPGYKDLLAVYQTDGLKALRQAWDDLSRSAAGRQLVRLVASDAPAMAARPDWLLDEDQIDQLQPPTFLIQDIIPAAETTMVTGPSDAGKTFLVVDMAMRVAQFYSVVYIAAEDARGIKIRKQAWERHYKRPHTGRFYLRHTSVSLTDKNAVADLIAGIRPLEPRLVVIDTLSQCATGADENNAKDMTEVLANAQSICRETGAAVIIIHHTTKNSTDYRGSGALKANTYAHLKVENEDGTIRLTCDRIKNTRGFTPLSFKLVEVEIDAETRSCIPLPAERVIQTRNDRLTRDQSALLSTIELVTETSDGATTKDLFTGSGLTYIAFHRVLKTLRSLGYIEEEREGRSKMNRITPLGRQMLARSIGTPNTSIPNDNPTPGGFIVNPTLKPQTISINESQIGINDLRSDEEQVSNRYQPLVSNKYQSPDTPSEAKTPTSINRYQTSITTSIKQVSVVLPPLGGGELIHDTNTDTDTNLETYPEESPPDDPPPNEPPFDDDLLF